MHRRGARAPPHRCRFLPRSAGRGSVPRNWAAYCSSSSCCSHSSTSDGDHTRTSSGGRSIAVVWEACNGLASTWATAARESWHAALRAWPAAFAYLSEALRRAPSSQAAHLVSRRTVWTRRPPVDRRVRL